MAQYHQVTGVVMAGGQGRRFGGQDKGWLQFKGRALIEHVLEHLRPQVEHIVISANRNQERYASLGYPVVSDDIDAFQGPLAGVAAVMPVVTTQYIVTVPCDGPLLASDLVDRLVTEMKRNQVPAAVAGVGDNLEPLYACIDCGLKENLHNFLAAGNRQVRQWFSSQSHVVVDFSDEPDAFSNINSAEDLDRLLLRDAQLRARQ